MTNHTLLLLAEHNHPTLVTLVNNWLSTHPKEINPVHSARTLNWMYKILLLSVVAFAVGVISLIAYSTNPAPPMVFKVLLPALVASAILGFVGIVVTRALIYDGFKGHKEFLGAVTLLESLKDVGAIRAHLVRVENPGAPDTLIVRLSGGWEHEVGVRQEYRSTCIQNSIESALREKAREVKTLQEIPWRKEEAQKKRDELDHAAKQAHYLLKMPADVAYYFKRLASTDQ